MSPYVAADPDALARQADQLDTGAGDLEQISGRLHPEAADTAQQLNGIADWGRGAAAEQRRAVENIRRFNRVDSQQQLPATLREPAERAASTVRTFLGQAESMLRGRRAGVFYASDPVNTATGNFIHTDTDLLLPPVASRLSPARTYNSTDTTTGPFGVGWSSCHTIHLTHHPWGLELHDADGRRVPFTRHQDGELRPPPGIHATLTQNPDGRAELTWFGGEQWQFDPAGRITAVRDPEGTSLTYHYRNGQLARVLHSTSRHLLITTDHAGRITTIRSDDGRETRYAYDRDFLIAVSGPDGATTRYDVDPAGLIVRVTDPDGYPVIANQYDGYRRVIAQTTPGGQRTTFAYDPSGRTTVTHPATGATSTFIHDERGMTAQITDPAGHRVIREHDDAGNILRETSRLGHVRTQQFDTRGLLLERTGFDGATERFTYDNDGRMTTATDPLGATTRFTYAGTSRIPRSITSPTGAVTHISTFLGQLTRLRDPDGVTTRIDYDHHANPVRIRPPGSTPTEITYDPAGRVIRTTNGNGDATITYDHAGHPTSVRDPAGATATLKYSAAGRPLQSTDARGAHRRVIYDSAGRAAQAIDPFGHVTRYHYSPTGELARIEHPDGACETFEHDQLARLTALTDATGNRTSLRYDADGNLHAITDATGATWTRSLDDAARVIAATDPTGVTSRLAYDTAGRLVAFHDPANGTTRLSYDRDGRPTTIELPAGERLGLRYTRGGRLRRWTDHNGGRIEFGYDAAGQLTSAGNGNGTGLGLNYDLFGRLESLVSPEGPIGRIAYDRGGRPTELTTADHARWHMAWSPRGDLQKIVDPVGATRQLDYDAAGRIAAATDPNDGTVRLGYDPRGRLTDLTDQAGCTRRFQHDPAGRVIAEIDPLDRITRCQHDQAGRLHQVDDPSGRSLCASWDHAGRLLRVTSAEGNAIEQTYDAAGRLHQVRGRGGANSYTYDELGRVTEFARDGEPVFRYAHDGPSQRRRERVTSGITEHQCDDGGEVTITTDDLQYRRRHDVLGRPTEEHVNGPVRRRWSYHHGGLASYLEDIDGHVRDIVIDTDPIGRITAHRSAVHETRYRYDPAGQLIEVADGDAVTRYAYDERGNRIRVEHSDGRTEHYTYDPAGQCTTIHDSRHGERRFTYDAAGRRTQERRPDGNTKYTYDDFGLLTRLERSRPDGTLTETRTYDSEGRLVTVSTQTGTQTSTTSLEWDPTTDLPELCGLHSDGHRSDYFGHPLRPSIQSSGDRTQSLPQDLFGSLAPDGAPFDAFGIPQPDTPHNHVRRGYRSAPHIGDLIHLTYRDYDPSTGQFLTPDPLTGPLASPTAITSYPYAANDPINRFDPLGLQAINDTAIRGDTTTATLTAHGPAPAGFPDPSLPTGPSPNFLDQTLAKLTDFANKATGLIHELLAYADKLEQRALQIGRAVTAKLGALVHTGEHFGKWLVTLGRSFLKWQWHALVSLWHWFVAHLPDLLSAARHGLEAIVGVIFMVSGLDSIAAGAGGDFAGFLLIGTGGGALVGIPAVVLSTAAILAGGALALGGGALAIKGTSGVLGDLNRMFSDSGTRSGEPSDGKRIGEELANRTPRPGGSIDETERTLSEDEKRAAQVYEAEGRKVVANKDVQNVRGRHADVEVDGVKVEFKTPHPAPGNPTTDATIRNEVTESLRRGGQARHMLIDARGTGLTQAKAEKGLNRVAGITRGKLDSVRIVGDGFDVSRTYP